MSEWVVFAIGIVVGLVIGCLGALHLSENGLYFFTSMQKRWRT
jgi:uncharacterized membrane-anchored protein YhcB (DUF1043 family)